MKVFVTGGAGFIGRHLTESLLEKGHLVTIFDDFSNSDKTIHGYLSNLGANVIEGDITNKHQVITEMKNQEIVIHLAAKISVAESIKNPQDTMRVNVNGTVNVLEGCIKNKIKNVIVISSAAVYGDTESSTIILDEESDTNPLSPYGKSKLLMEQNVKKFAEENKINCIILRIFNIYGKGQSDEYAGVITKFATRIQNNKPLVIFGDGLQTRDFVSIDDVVSVISTSMLISGRYGRIYNIGYGKSVSIKKLANLMIKASGKKLAIEFSDSKECEIRFSQASINRAKNELGYNPKISLEYGLKKFLNQ